jgi:hypothetical protein
MKLPQIKRCVAGVAIVSLAVYSIMCSLTNGASLTDPNAGQLAVEILVILAFFALAILEQKNPAAPAAAAPKPAPLPRKPR